MVKAYLRYEPSQAFGVIASNANVEYDDSGRVVFTSTLENITEWNVKQGVQTRSFNSPSPIGTSFSVAEVTIIQRAPQGRQLAVGYSDGTVRLFDLSTGECQVTLKGHKSAVTALRYHPSGALLATGARDTDIIVWDVVGETGLFRLRGHKGQVTDVVFISRSNQLVSSSKDGYVRVWDLDTQHCSQTLVGFKGEVWSLDVDPRERRLVTGSNDLELRMYAIHQDDEDEELLVASDHLGPADGQTSGALQEKSERKRSRDEAESEDASRGSVRAPTLRAMGSLRRQSQDRAVRVRYDSTGSVLVCQTAGKQLEVFRVRSEAEARKKSKRRKKRKLEKLRKKEGEGAEAEAGGALQQGEEEHEEEEEAGMSLQASDEACALQLITLKHKIKGMALAPRPAIKKGHLAQMAVSLANNMIEVLEIKEATQEFIQRIDQGGHRSDVRSVALSPDDQLLLSCSSSSVKTWNPRTGVCTSTMDSGYGLCAIFVPGLKHAVIGTKEGTIEIFDLGASSRVHVEAAHKGPCWSLALLPNKTGFVSGGADHQVKFWQWKVITTAEGERHLTLHLTRTLEMAEDVLCVRVSPDGKLVAVALLDATVKVYFLDSLKFMLSLYGHKLPVLCMDISSDSTLLVTGSADKNIKVWGLDFGDCHKSIFAHQDAVMNVSFVRNTHYCFTVGKDKMLKYWDLDRFELLLELSGHHGEVWSLAVSQFGDFVITGSHDRSLRRWERTSEPFFVEEEKERRLESLFEGDVEKESAARDTAGDEGQEDDGGGTVALAGRRTLENVSAADNILDALDVAAFESEKYEEYDREKKSNPDAPAPVPNPLMLGLTPSSYVLKAISNVRANDLEQALLVLPFTSALRLLDYLTQWLKDGAQVEMTCRVAVFLLRLHHAQLVATPGARRTLVRLLKPLRRAVQTLKHTLGFNMAAMKHLQRLVKGQSGMTEADTVIAARQQLQVAS